MRSGKELREQIHDPCEVDNLAQLKKKKKNCNWSCGSSGLSWISFFLTQVTLKHKNGLGSFLRRTPMIMHPNQALNLFDIPMYLSGYPSSTTEWLNKHGSMSSLWVCQILNVLRCSCPAFVLIF